MRVRNRVKVQGGRSVKIKVRTRTRARARARFKRQNNDPQDILHTRAH